MRKAALHNLGCKVNSYETEAMQQLLEAAGYQIVDFEEKADVYIINTCSVTNVADKKSRQMLHRAKAKNPEALVVAAGCYAQAAGEKLLDDTAIDLVIGNNKKAELVQLLEERLAGREPQDAVIDISAAQEYEALHIERQADHTRAFIKVQDGCNQFCSYCIIPYTRGRVRSRRPEDVEEEVRTLAEKGYQEIVLTGIHLSSYGTDFKEEPQDLLELTKRLHQIPGVKRIRFGSLEPRLITEEFVRELSAMEKICPHFHLSLQSGCDATLKRMNRHYTCEDYLYRCGILRKYFRDPAITTDVIVGFPGGDPGGPDAGPGAGAGKDEAERRASGPGEGDVKGVPGLLPGKGDGGPYGGACGDRRSPVHGGPYKGICKGRCAGSWRKKLLCPGSVKRIPDR